MREIAIPIVLSKENWILSYIVSMFAIIKEATSSRKFRIEGNAVFIDTKEQEEIFHFDDASLEALEVRLFENFLGNPLSQVLILSKEESELFVKCSHAAYYFETEKNQGKNLGDDSFIAMHEKLFRQE